MPPTSTRGATIALIIALLLIGAGIFIFAHWLWFGGERQNASFAFFLMATGMIVAFGREFTIRR